MLTIAIKFLSLLVLISCSQHGKLHQDEMWQKMNKSQFSSVRSVGDANVPVKIMSNACMGEFCDPGHEPYSNIVAAMTGYNILKGNPYSTEVEQDPGFETAYIFSPVVQDKDTRYALHSGITVRQVRKCDMSTKINVFSNIEGYRRQMMKSEETETSFQTNPPIDISGELGGVELSTTMKELYKSSSSQSKATQANAEYFAKKKGVVTINDATCAEYVLQISYRNPPRFSETFRKALKVLNTIVTMADEEAKRIFHAFINDFGTHFLTHVTMGSRLAIQRRYTKKEYKHSTLKQMEKCNKERMGVNLVSSLNTETSACSQFQDSQLDNTLSQFSREEVISYGSKPTIDLESWAEQDFVAPLPIKMKMDPIINLFDRSFKKHDDDKVIDGEQIRYRAILARTRPWYATLCVDEYGQNSCNPEREGVICGVNDGCEPLKDECLQTENEDEQPEVICFDGKTKRIKQKAASLIKKVVEKRNEQNFEDSFSNIEFDLAEMFTEFTPFFIYADTSNTECQKGGGQAFQSALSRSRTLYFGWQANFVSSNVYNEIKIVLKRFDDIAQRKNGCNHLSLDKAKKIFTDNFHDKKDLFGFVLICWHNKDGSNPRSLYRRHITDVQKQKLLSGCGSSELSNVVVYAGAKI
ncbi:uncharacterized protein LOC130649358 [Hydractinia symbiolongicarpus]|uniref:uncharacterized protein LOC130649358 n=1 Tax=Hydractinia symbiolongicarpus TaxID=13093 RepID=UPI00254AC2A2|nr:uncharacterized protein LOC130649358 [Hydractinia symbiolongicarpus]